MSDTIQLLNPPQVVDQLTEKEKATFSKGVKLGIQLAEIAITQLLDKPCTAEERRAYNRALGRVSACWRDE